MMWFGTSPQPAKPRRSKYGNVRTKANGISYASKKEAFRSLELRQWLKEGRITDLREQVTFVLTVNDHQISRYIADFTYREIPTGELIVEDVKGVITDVYRLKRDLMLAIYDIKIRET